MNNNATNNNDRAGEEKGLIIKHTFSVEQSHRGLYWAQLGNVGHKSHD